jgi:hypothetical protein
MSILWSIGSTRGTIFIEQANFRKWLVNYWAVPASVGNEFPNDTQGTVTLTLILVYQTEAGYEEISANCTFTAKVNPTTSAPTISVPRVKDTNAKTVALTGDSSKIVLNASAAQIAYDVGVKNGATIAHQVVDVGGIPSNSNPATFYSMPAATFKVYVRDSRNFATSINYTIPAERVIEYVKLTCNPTDNMPNTSGVMQAACSGNYFNGSFGAADNTLKVEYCYMEATGSAYVGWTEMSVSVSGNTYRANATISGLDYQKEYVFQYRVTDAIGVKYSAEASTRSKPVYHWSKTDFVHETPVDFRAGIRANGVESDIIVEQGTSGMWTYRKWNSGLAECWGQKSRSIYASEWTNWGGSWHQAEMLVNEAYPFTFTDTPKETATLYGMMSGLLECSSIGMSNNKTGGYYVVTPYTTSSTFGFLLNIYACGRWK